MVFMPLALLADACVAQVSPDTTVIGVPPTPIAATNAGPDEKADALHEEAGRLYRAKDYGAACPKYRAAASLAPLRGDLWADLGLCLSRLGKKEQAKQATLEAVSRGSRDVRLRAYFNLYRIGVRLTPPQEDCIKWPCSRPGCSKPMYACRYTETCNGGSGMFVDATGLSFCPNDEDAKTYQPSCHLVESCFAVELKVQVIARCKLDDQAACVEDVDSKACEEALTRCQEGGNETRSQQCVFVYADAERKRLGAICNGKAIEVSSGSDLWIHQGE